MLNQYTHEMAISLMIGLVLLCTSILFAIIASNLERRDLEWPFVVTMTVFLPLSVLIMLPTAGLTVAAWLSLGLICVSMLWCTLHAFAALVCHLSTREAGHHGQDLPHVAMIIPALLDNEKKIICESLNAHAKSDYAGRVSVFLIYSARDAHDIKMIDTAYALRRDWHDKQVNNTTFKVLHSASKDLSKAANVNCCLDFIQAQMHPTKSAANAAGLTVVHLDSDAKAVPELIGIFDGDHHPAANCITRAVQHFQNDSLDIIQGQCQVRDSSFFFWEFEDVYQVQQQGRDYLWKNAVFGGNGFWRAPLLMQHRLDVTKQTENVDASLRATLAGARVRYCADVHSTEMAPGNFTSLIAQRRRWAFGWLQASQQYLRPACRHNAAFLQLLLWHPFICYTTMWPFLIVIVTSAKGKAEEVFTWNMLWVFCILILMHLFRGAVLAYIGNGRKYAHLAVYLLLYPLYQCLLAVVSVAGHYRAIIKNNEWPVTKRADTPSPPQPRRPSFAMPSFFSNTHLLKEVKNDNFHQISRSSKIEV